MIKNKVKSFQYYKILCFNFSKIYKLLKKNLTFLYFLQYFRKPKNLEALVIEESPEEFLETMLIMDALSKNT